MIIKVLIYAPLVAKELFNPKIHIISDELEKTNKTTLSYNS